jgi:hypothetical protein
VSVLIALTTISVYAGADKVHKKQDDLDVLLQTTNYVREIHLKQT